MVYIFCVIIMCTSAYIGIKLPQILIKRAQFFKKLGEFCDFYKMKISFFQTKVSSIIDEFTDKHSSQLNQIFIEIKKYMLDGNGVEFLKQYNFLKADEIEIIKSFITELGKNNVDNQILLADKFADYVNRIALDCESKSVKQKGVIFKISLACGAVISILII